MHTYFQICTVLRRTRVERVSAQLFELGCCGIAEEDQSDGSVRLIAYFEAVQNRTAFEARMRQALPQYECRIDPVPDEDWTTEWRSFFQPVYPTPRIAVCPPWKRVPDPPGGFAIAIEPQMAFGTGHHETTRLALLGLDKQIAKGDRVLDVGTGSGILSIATAKLGAAEVMAVDIEASAIENARANCVLNNVVAQVNLSQQTVDGGVRYFRCGGRQYHQQHFATHVAATVKATEARGMRGFGRDFGTRARCVLRCATRGESVYRRDAPRGRMGMRDSA